MIWFPVINSLPEGSGQESPQERLQNKVIIIRKCLSEALAEGPPGQVPEQCHYHQELLSRGAGRGSPQERLQSKVIIIRKCLLEALAEGFPRKGPRTI